ncbi:sigma-70 family RNA polymerase sigma factor [Microbacterium sp. cx-55]|uniref:RNA polymerase sigma factor n=1 Tax=Microbacterium sp. cx-55 TaxID=2875948 RepID=UPI001CC04FBD|nr:sigma-70 family RNA polymerase sigma factor [Microbacterium sp. cx-55]UGB35541.1 sigma-70 family RNA polymerase sigma factor [Microbacterium sp. cx-55]
MEDPDRPEMPLAEVPDQILVERAIDGDTVAFREIVRRHSGLMRAYVTRMLSSATDADDVVQDAFVVAWRQLPSLRDGAAVRAWLMRIASREAYAVIRRRGREEPIEDRDFSTPVDTRPEHVAIRNARLAALSDALDMLPDAQRRAWLLRESVGLGYAEIAAEMDLPVSTVRGNLARARASIMIRMEEWR